MGKEEKALKVINYNNEINIKKSAVALGKFQGIHKGHMLLIDKIVSLARSEGLESVVFTVNPGVEKNIFTTEERHNILEKLNVDIDIECPMTEDIKNMSCDNFIREIIVDKLHAAYVVVGEDFKFGHLRAGDVDTLKDYGLKYNFEVVSFEKLKIDSRIVSSTLLRSYIQSGDMINVSKYMGREYFISGDVIYGKQLGRTISFPTANINISECKLLPKFGVYKTFVYLDGKRYEAITNIGNNPTVSDDLTVKSETHILDFDRNIYGRNITVYFEDFIRPEMKFDTIFDLKKQINKDISIFSHQ